MRQAEGVFRLGSDSEALGGFTQVKKKEKVLDLGCGGGVLGLYLLARERSIQVTGLELNPDAVELARENFAANGLDAGVVQGDMRSVRELFPAGHFDLVISNPPYYDPGRGFSSRTDILATARNERSGDIFDVCRTAGQALKWGGRFYVCYPPVRLADLMEALRAQKLEPKTMRLVFPDERHAPCLVMVEARKGGGAGLNILPSLMIARNGEKTEEFKRIYQLEEDQDAR